MAEEFKLFIKQLEEGKKEIIHVSVDPAFLALHENDLFFPAPIQVMGEAYTTSINLILNFKCNIKLKMPCSICNKFIEVEIRTENAYYDFNLKELTSAIFNYTEVVREEVILNIPHFVECASGNCPERKGVAPYLRQPTKKPETQFPFADLD